MQKYNSNNKRKNQRQSRRKAKTPTAFLRRYTSQLDCGELITRRDGTRSAIHLNTNESTIQALSNKDFRRLRRISNLGFDNHFNNRTTFYFAGSHQRFTLIMIDVDCKSSGSAEGAKAYCDFLAKNRLLRKLYHEPSTNGRGRHGYFLLDTLGQPAEEINALLLRKLAPYLNDLAEEFDVEFVEIKGTIPVVQWDQGKVSSYKAGTLAKFPREVNRFAEWLEMPVITIHHLSGLSPKPRVKQDKPTPEIKGSCSGSLISDDHLEQLDHYREVAESLMSGSVATTGRHKATVEDMAIFLMLGKVFTENMNDDGSMPRARFEANWTQLYQTGRVSRGFDRKRFAVLRNLLSDLGLIEWEDHHYRAGTDTRKGQACKWRFCNDLMQELNVSNLVPPKMLYPSLKQEDAKETFPPTDDFTLKFSAKNLDNAEYTRPVQLFDSDDLADIYSTLDRIVSTWQPMDHPLAA